MHKSMPNEKEAGCVRALALPLLILWSVHYTQEYNHQNLSRGRILIEIMDTEKLLTFQVKRYVFNARTFYYYSASDPRSCDKPSTCKKKVNNFSVPSWDVANQTLPGREHFHYSRPGRVWLVTSRPKRRLEQLKGTQD